MKKAAAIILCLILFFTGCATVKNTNSKIGSENIASRESVNTEAAAEASLIMNKETDHFKIYCQSQDMDCLEDVGKGLEAAYKKVTTEFNCSLDNKVEVLIYPDIESFHAAIGNTDTS